MRAPAVRPAGPAPILLVALLVGAGVALAFGAPPARAASSGSTASSVSGSVSGPTYLGESLKANYTVEATGGPAEASNGTTVGNYSFTANLTGANTTDATLTPTSGILTNNSAALLLVAPAVVEELTISVIVTSTGVSGNNESGTFTYDVNVVEPFTFNATLYAAAGYSVGPFALTVTLDGSPVGQVHVPEISSGSSYTVTFDYVDVALSPGWHTFAISLAAEHGLVTFPGGAQQYTDTFYVSGPAPNYTGWYVAGVGLFAAVLFIWATRVAGRRGGRAKK